MKFLAAALISSAALSWSAGCSEPDGQGVEAESRDAAADVGDAHSDTRSDAGLSSDGCGSPGAETGLIEVSVTVGGVARQAWIRIPASYSGADPLTLIFNWHGYGNDARQAASWLGVPALAGDESILVYPQGRPAWDASDVNLYDALVEYLESNYCVNSDQVYTIGYSAGGNLSNFLACERPGAMAGSAVVAFGLGYPSSAFPNCPPIPTLSLYGLNDPNGAPEHADASLEWVLNANNCTDESAPVTGAGLPPTMVCRDYHNCDAPVRFCTHEGAHEWPGVACQRAIWDFFDPVGG